MTVKAKKLRYEDWNTDVVIEAGRRYNLRESDEFRMVSSFVQRKTSYIVAGEFFDVLSSVDLKLSPSHIPLTNEAVYIQYPQLLKLQPQGGLLPTDEYVGGSFVGVFDQGQDGFAYERGKTFVMMTYPLNKYGKRTGGDFLIAIMSLHYDSLEEAWNRYDAESIAPDPVVRMLTSNLLKLLVYIKSGDPDLRFLSRPKGPGQRREQAKDLGYFYEQDVYHVGFDWKKSRIFSVASTKVRSHFRWQPCGPNRENVKLILIDEHNRNFSNHALGTRTKRGEAAEVIELQG